ncbi:hypothetical protein KAR91_34440 [Candidatus Pacearchaeota archaeon]|nr:hypothetical protein [Candidatus Pacearchaeota archaeon]
MNLLQIRTKVVQLSGRYDLVVDDTDYVDSGMDFFVTAGQRYLENKELVKPSTAKHYATLAVDDNYLVFQHCRAIHEVWVSDSEGRTQLEVRGFDTIRGWYNKPVADLTTSKPKYYAPATLRTSPETSAKITIESFGGTAVEESITEAIRYTYNGIIFGPPADETYEIEVIGLFWLPEMTVDADTNYWSVVMPHILVYATLFQLEMYYRNDRGVALWKRSLDEQLASVGMDLVSEEEAGFDQMEG